MTWIDCPLLSLTCVGSNPAISSEKKARRRFWDFQDKSTWRRVRLPEIASEIPATKSVRPNEPPLKHIFGGVSSTTH